MEKPVIRAAQNDIRMAVMARVAIIATVVVAVPLDLWLLSIIVDRTHILANILH